MRKINSHFADFEKAKKINSHFTLQTLNKQKKICTDFEQMKKRVILLTLNKSFVKNSFRRNSVTYGTPYHAIGHFVLWYHHVTYRTPCHVSGRLVIYRECYSFDRAFFTLRRFLPYTPSCCFQDFPGAGSWTSKLAGFHADLWNLAPVRLFV